MFGVCTKVEGISLVDEFGGEEGFIPPMQIVDDEIGSYESDSSYTGDVD
jgi:hypothetical protein